MATKTVLYEPSADVVFIGTDVKVAFTPSATGFDIDNDEWSVEIKYGSNETAYKTFTREDMIVEQNPKGENVYSVILDTSNMVGLVFAVVRVRIPDRNCDDGIRKEVAKFELFKVYQT